MQMLHKLPIKNIEELLVFGKNSLARFSPTPFLDCEILLSNSIGTKKEFLITHKDFVPNKTQTRSFLKNINKRKSGFPIAYIINKKEFYGLDFFVGKGVLIPRPETEQIIEIAKDIIEKNFTDSKSINILEIGTGSGCIPIVMKKQLGEKIILNTFEVSKKAYKYALLNFNSIKPGKINFTNANAFILRKHTLKYDLIISNPPYLTNDDMESIKIEVKNEPRKALFGGQDGLEYYFKLKRFLKEKLNSNGFAIFEINEKLGKKTAAIFIKEYSCRIIKDYFGKDRFLVISRQ